MLKIYRRCASGAEPQAPSADWRPPEDTVWIDLKSPSREEEVAVETALGIDIPTLQEMAQLEPSSRLYQENGATFMSANLLARSEEGPKSAPTTFILTGGVLVTVRYEDLRAFSVFAERAPHSELTSGTQAFLGLLDAIVERLADVLEDTSAHVENAAQSIFRRSGQIHDFQPLLTELSRAQSVTSITRTALVSLSRMLGYASLAQEISGDPECQAHLRTLRGDVQSLTEHSGFQQSHISFLLDAALGLINVEQNGIIKIFSVVAVIFMPPTLVASIYGMNFHHMPELDWRFGYPMALVMMVISAILPVLYFRRRGWF